MAFESKTVHIDIVRTVAEEHNFGFPLFYMAFESKIVHMDMVRTGAETWNFENLSAATSD